MVDDTRHKLLVSELLSICTMRSFKLAGFAFLVCLALVACRRGKATPPTNAVPATESAASLGIQPTDLPDHKTLYAAINRYMAANQGRAARDIEELVQKGFLKPLPALPKGKRYDLDQRSALLTIVDN